ncbi:MAG: protein translocase subunit SecF [Andreesenia angusta]|nr:protein translocase subunit SecF [Andreesenia angusta]
MKNINIIKHRKIYFAISIIFIIAGIISIFARGLNYGLDFTGGTSIGINLEKEIDADEIREITDKYDKKAMIVHVGDDKKEIMIKSSKNISSQDSMTLFKDFKDKYNLKSKEPLYVESIGATIGKEIQKNALTSILIAALFMLVYISIRFEFKFGIAAVLGLIHDLLIMVSVYAIFRFTIDSSFIAAILTITGYSINDTIIIFDRIRENSSKGRIKSYDDLVNKSIVQTIRRTLFTSITTLVTLVLIYILGVESIKTFALPLLIGIVVGTLSSVLIASPIWYLLTIRDK